MNTHLHFTFGPVQSFVAQARRTRDLYAGSLLLSHLAITAMKAAGGDKIILPDFKALSEAESKSDHATAPNRFVAKFDSDANAAAAGHAAAEALRKEWRKIADAVWSRYLKDHAGTRTTEIWQRQVENFWNIAWVVGPENETDLLDRRKNWQTQSPPVEGGDHCVLMGHLQELSGFIRSQRRREQDDFWEAVRRGFSNVLDLEEGERLCAIAFIKRFWKLDTKGWPSTVTIAALPWMMEIAKAKPEVQKQAADYANLVRNEPGALVSSADRIQGLKNFPDSLKTFAKLSGNFLNRIALANKDDTPQHNEEQRPAARAALCALESAAGERAGNFYAVLLMDGDSMGALIGQHGPEKVTRALTNFATQIPDIIAEHDGVCVYAGGDDLLALLPLDRALDAARAAHRLYLESFGTDIAATVSAAIVFAHYRCTFSRVLTSAHELLDDVAKDRTGRDALAIRVLKPGGVSCEWSVPFKHLTKTIPDKPHLFAPLLENFRAGGLSASLLYNLRERFKQLTQGDAACIQRSELHALFTAEALIGKRHDENFEVKRTAAKELMERLLDVCEIMRRNPKTKEVETTGKFTFDGPRLVKFLALDGKEDAE